MVTLLILHEALDGYSRFEQFQENLGISSSLLTSRLKRLVANGLLERRKYQSRPPRFEYVLTDLGRSLRPVIVVLAAWGTARLPAEERNMVLVDATTGIEAEPTVVDAKTGRRADGPDLMFTAGPAASKAFATDTKARRAPGSRAGGRSARQNTARRLAGGLKTRLIPNPHTPRQEPING